MVNKPRFFPYDYRRQLSLSDFFGIPMDGTFVSSFKRPCFLSILL